MILNDKLNSFELDTPTIARELPMKIKRWDSFSATNICKSSPTSN
jgi:hypothetical protein